VPSRIRTRDYGVCEVWYHASRNCLTIKFLVSCRYLTSYLSKSTFLWVVTPRSLERTRCFGGTYGFYLQGRRVSQSLNQQRQSESWACLSRTSGCPQTTWRNNPDNCTLHVTATRTSDPTSCLLFSSMFVCLLFYIFILSLYLCLILLNILHSSRFNTLSTAGKGVVIFLLSALSIVGNGSTVFPRQ
jgi:hypothetical protein